MNSPSDFSFPEAVPWGQGQTHFCLFPPLTPPPWPPGTEGQYLWAECSGGGDQLAQWADVNGRLPGDVFCPSPEPCWVLSLKVRIFSGLTVDVLFFFFFFF